MHRPLFRSLIAGLTAAFALLVAAPSAHAHAILVDSRPAAAQLVAEPPSEVALTFNERVSVALGGVQVFSPSGATVNEGSGVAAANRVRVGLTADDVGTYAVSWRVLSADGHPVRGAFVFSIGERSQSAVAEQKAVAASSADRPLTLAFGALRFVYLFGVLLAAGGAIFAALVAPGWRARWLAPLLLAVIGASAVGFVLEAAVAAGIGVDDALDPDVLQTQLSTLYGNAALVRVALVILGLVALRLASPLQATDRLTRFSVAGIFAALAMSTSIAGHAMATEPIGLRVPVDMLHVLVAAAWVGGLLQLYHYCASDRLQAPAVVRYSRLALGCVVVLIATGTFAALAESDVSLNALVDSSYGRILGGKIALLALAIPLARVNRTRNVPAIVAAASDAPSRLRRFVRGELLILLGVVALTAWLIDTTPARHAAHRQVQPPQPVVETRTLPSGSRVTLIVQPGATGANTVRVSVRTASGAHDRAVDHVDLTASLPGRRIEKLPLKVKRTAPGRWNATAQVLPLAGRWRLVIALRRGEFDEERTHVDADIRSATTTTGESP